jgi:hypothetical protein
MTAKFGAVQSQTYNDGNGNVLVAETREQLLTLDAALSLIKREQGREARSILMRAYGCYCARVVTRTDKLLNSALKGAGIKLALSTAKRDASIYFDLAVRGIVREGVIVEDYVEFLETIAAAWDRLSYACKIPSSAPADSLILASLAKKSDLALIVRYNKDSATVQKITVLDCIKDEGDSIVFVLPEAVQVWAQSQKQARREITSGEIGSAVGVLLSALESGSEQAIDALHVLASRAGYQLVAVTPAPVDAGVDADAVGVGAQAAS